MSYKQGFAPLLVLIILVAVIGAGGAYIFKQNIPANTPASDSTVVNPTPIQRALEVKKELEARDQAISEEPPSSPPPAATKPLLKIISSATAGWAEDPAWKSITYPNCTQVELDVDSRGQAITTEFDNHRLILRLLNRRTQDPNFSKQLCIKDGTFCHNENSWQTVDLNGTSLQFANEEIKSLQFEDDYKLYAVDTLDGLCLSKYGNY